MVHLTKQQIEETQKIISYELPSGTIFYSHLSYIGKDLIVYDGKDITALSETTITELRKGKESYEAYKFHNQIESIEQAVKHSTQEELSTTLKPIFDKMVEEIKATKTDLKSHAENIFTEAEQVLSKVKDSRTTIKTIADKLESVDKHIDLDKIAQSIQSKVDSLDEVKAKFNDVIASLQSLFK